MSKYDLDLLPEVVAYNAEIINSCIYERGLCEIMENAFTKDNFQLLIDTIVFSNDVNENYRTKVDNIVPLSVSLYLINPFFKPLYFWGRFDKLQRLCDAIGLELPPLPSATKHKDCILYYYDLCVAFKNFQEQNNLNDAELCACIYDFAPMLIDNETTDELELPKPTNVWLTGASGRDDFELLDSICDEGGENITGIWACNERTRRGDIIVIYCKSPRSYIHSVWRATTEGIFAPFNYYHNRITLGKGVRIPDITYRDIKTDNYLSQIPIVRKNLQGINGVELTALDYKEILRVIEEKGGDISLLPKLMEGTIANFGEIKLEKDVEENILIPMLKELGYSENDWTRQLSLKAGRSEKAIPDFVFFSKGTRHFETAPFVIEAKLDMSRATEQKNAYNQALSYAKMLHAKIMGICDKERLIIYKADKDGMFDRNKPVFENHWVVIYSDEIVKTNLNQLIGYSIISKIK